MTSDVFVECLKKKSYNPNEVKATLDGLTVKGKNYATKKALQDWRVIDLSDLSLALESKIKKEKLRIKNLKVDLDKGETLDGVFSGAKQEHEFWIEWLELCVKEAKK